MGIDIKDIFKPSVLDARNMRNPLKGTAKEAKDRLPEDSFLRKIKNPLK